MGVDAVIDFVNALKTVETEMQNLRRRARGVLVGLVGGALQLNLVTMPTRAHKLIGSHTGTMTAMVELVSLARGRIIKPIISDKITFGQATKALAKLKAGKIDGRALINL